MPEGINRRRFPRVDFACWIKVQKEKTSEVIFTQTTNLSVGGLGVVLKKYLSLFSEVEMGFNLEDGRPEVGCRGKVVWVVRKEEYGSPPSFDTGIEFIGLKPNDRERIEKVIQMQQKNK